MVSPKAQDEQKYTKTSRLVEADQIVAKSPSRDRRKHGHNEQNGSQHKDNQKSSHHYVGKKRGRPAGRPTPRASPDREKKERSVTHSQGFHLQQQQQSQNALVQNPERSRKMNYSQVDQFDPILKNNTNKREQKRQHKEAHDSDENIRPLKAGKAAMKARMSSKELFFLIVLYLQDPHGRSSKEYKQMPPGTVLRLLQELRNRLDHLDLDQVKYGLKQLERSGKVKALPKARYQLKTPEE